jgi:hypothetical protein
MHVAGHNIDSYAYGLLVVGTALIIYAIVGINTGVTSSPRRTIKRSENESDFWFSIWLTVAIGAGCILMALYDCASRIFNL